MEESDTEVFILGTVGLGSIEREIKSMLEAGAKGVVLHGSLADREIDLGVAKMTWRVHSSSGLL